MVRYTRKDYLEGKCSHREYYGQFVNEETKALVVRAIGLEKLLHSTREHFNDIPLSRWDALVPRAPGSTLFTEAGDYYTPSGGVCLLKEAARQIVESHQTEIAR